MTFVYYKFSGEEVLSFLRVPAEYFLGYVVDDLYKREQKRLEANGVNSFSYFLKILEIWNDNGAKKIAFNSSFASEDLKT